MAASELRCNTAKVVFQKTASIVTTIGFLAAAVFLLGVLWLPANAAPSSSEVTVQPELLLALDKPQPPAPKIRLASLMEDAKALPDDLPSPELATELNSWTFTANTGIGGGLFLYTQWLAFTTGIEMHILYIDATFLKAFVMFEANIYQSLGLNVPGFLTAEINALTAVQNALSPWR